MPNPNRFQTRINEVPERAPATPQHEPPVELVEAGKAKAELNRLLRKLYDEHGRIRERRAFMQMRQHREIHAETVYVPAIARLRALGRERLEAEKRILVERLNKGYAMLNLDDAGHDLFATLLCQYEACADAVNDDALAGTLGRLMLIEQGVR